MQPTQTHYNALKRDTSLHHNQYIIKQVLGEPGGFGIAYLAIDTRLDKQVVIKEFLPDEIAYRDGDTVRAKTNTDKDNLEWGLDKFKEEAKVLAKFNHPNIVRVLNFFEDNDTAYFVMDYEEGEDLDIYLKRLGRDLTQGEIVSIIVPILDGLKEVHSYDFLHRDIKPGNIYIRSNGSPMLIDFGAARNAIGVKSKSITQILTPGYAPTEQYGSDVSKQGAFTDIYSIGAVLYKLVTNTTPIDAPDRSREVFEEENIDPLIPATQKANNSKYSKEFLEAIDWSLQIRAKNRPQNVVEFRDQLLGQCKLEEPEIKENPLTQLDEIIDMAGSDGIITKDEEMKILQKAKSLNIDENKAQEYLDQTVKYYDWEKVRKEWGIYIKFFPEDAKVKVNNKPYTSNMKFKSGTKLKIKISKGGYITQVINRVINSNIKLECFLKKIEDNKDKTNGLNPNDIDDEDINYISITSGIAKNGGDVKVEFDDGTKESISIPANTKDGNSYTAKLNNNQVFNFTVMIEEYNEDLIFKMREFISYLLGIIGIISLVTIIYLDYNRMSYSQFYYNIIKPQFYYKIIGKQRHNIIIRSNVYNDDVYIDGKSVGSTPVNLSKYPGEIIEIGIYKNGYYGKKVDYKVEKDDTLYLKLEINNSDY